MIQRRDILRQCSGVLACLAVVFRFRSQGVHEIVNNKWSKRNLGPNNIGAAVAWSRGRLTDEENVLILP